MSIYHLLPVDDIKEHEKSSTCACNPSSEIVNGNILVVHNSYDGREGLELANEVFNELNRKKKNE